MLIPFFADLFVSFKEEILIQIKEMYFVAGN